ncbi:lytic transglycosylase domain-containing protein [Alteromonas sp. a30]|uniref:lytic transglycosylase domain-containing protein n=1 Tax=Alteromonas sp. a30 TaxID=2730917 RepID=UPI00227EB375|nr:lytic transglycosylase domain-containing protein [Alteromonas sp. a30]MCY7296799.1 lytic transglycosylase domain-containing protein [Alteromonas sp. a30]
MAIRHWSLTLLVACFSFSAYSYAAEQQQSSEQDLQQLRKWFSRAESIAHSPNSNEFRFLKSKLEGYPLYPYVELKTLMRYPFLSNKERIERFLTEHEGSPLDNPLRIKWLKYLAKQGQSQLYKHFYRDIGNEELQCHLLRFKIQDPKQKQAVLDEVDKLWLVGESQPKACDKLFSIWEKAGRRTHEMVYQRLILAADGGKHTLIPYLKKLLPQDMHYLADLWLKVRRSPSYVSRVSRFPGINPTKEADILTYGLKRLIWRDRDLALKSWEKLKSRFPFNAEQKQAIAEKFAVGLALKNHEQAGPWLEKASAHTEDKEIFRWHLAHVLRQQDWGKAVGVVETAPEEVSKDEQFRYWAARSYGELKASNKAKLTLDTLSGERNYYGFMASGKLGKAPSLVDQPIEYTELELSVVANHPAARRAYEFIKIKRMTSARREWRFLLSELNSEQQAIAGVLADSWGWHHQAIRTFAQSGYMNDVSRRFPLAYREALSKSAKANAISPEWAFAITRRESSFMTDAYSGAGARGLMQLMPGTARYLEKSRVQLTALYDPEFNVQLGTRYLRYLMDKMNDNPVLATAAYNAGWRRVKDWLPERTGMPMDIWIETIPYKETRSYVKAVMAYKQIYASRLGRNKNLFLEYSNMRIPELGSF